MNDLLVERPDGWEAALGGWRVDCVCFEPSPTYEGWELSGPNGLQMICVAGGEPGISYSGSS